MLKQLGSMIRKLLNILSAILFVVSIAKHIKKLFLLKAKQ